METTSAVIVRFRDNGDNVRTGELVTAHRIVDDYILLADQDPSHVTVAVFSVSGGLFLFRTPLASVEVMDLEVVR